MSSERNIFTPLLPPPGAPHSAFREMQSLVGLRELAGIVAGLSAKLAEYQPYEMLDRDGARLSVLAAPRGQTDETIGFDHPFILTDETASSTGGTTARIKVSIGSPLMASMDWTDTISISGLDAPKNVVAGNLIFLKVTLAGPTAEIVVASTWDQYPSPIGWENAAALIKVQKYAYVVIGRVVASPVGGDVAALTLEPVGGTKLDVVQLVYSGLMLAQTCYKGVNVTYPIPWHSGEL